MPLAASSKTDAITELVDLLAANGEVADRAKVLDAVLARESTRTTGIGNGLAIPHGKTTGTKDLVMAIGKPAEAIDFQAIDNRPVNVVCLIISPPDRTTPHITALARVSKLMIDEAFRAKVAAATSAEELYQVIVERDSTL